VSGAGEESRRHLGWCWRASLFPRIRSPLPASREWPVVIRMDATARIETERRVAEESGFSTLSRLDEQLLATSSRLDRTKQQLYFPEAKGYR